ncbi:MAG TPA: M15 family metallopeptidase [Rhizomicrobium sp.]
MTNSTDAGASPSSQSDAAVAPLKGKVEALEDVIARVLQSGIAVPAKPPAREKDLWDKLGAISTAVAMIFVPVVLGFAANALNSNLKDKDIQVEVMKLAEDMLKADPSVVDQPGVRDWAENVLSGYSGVPLSPLAKKELNQHGLFGAASTESIDRNPDHLHPVLRAKVVTLLQRLQQEGLHFEVFEGFRSPSTQLVYYARGRLDGNMGTVTNAKPWGSIHSYGVAVDLVPVKDNKPDWTDNKAFLRMHAIAKELDLADLNSRFPDLPHIELKGVKLDDLRAGKYPTGGDAAWADNLTSAINRWRIIVLAIKSWGAAIPDAPVAPKI